MNSEYFHSFLPAPSRERLMHLMRVLENADISTINSRTLADWTGWTRETIRKDISLLGISRAPSKGYARLALLAAIKARLVPDAKSGRCCIVGLGVYGEMLLRYVEFKNSAFSIAAGFDRNVNRIETLNADFPLYSLSRLEEVIQKQHIEFAILADTPDAAPALAKRLVSAGIKGIVNATSAALPVGGAVRVENVSVITALERLNF